MNTNKYFAIITPQEKALPFYVATIGITENEIKIIREDGIEDYQLLYCVEGEGCVLINGKENIIEKGMGIFLPPNTRHYYFSTRKPWKTHWITFNGSGVKQILNLSPCIFKITHMQPLDSLFYEILNLPRDSIWAEESTVKLYTLIIKLKKYISIDKSLSIHEQRNRLAPVTDYIIENYSIPIGLDKLSELINVTPAHLCRLFKASYNIRVFDYITQLRLQKSKELLLSNPEISITDISKAVGYNSPSYFCLLFKKYENTTPELFKKMYVQKNKI